MPYLWVGLSEHELLLGEGNSTLSSFLSFIHLGGAVSGKTTILRGSQDCDFLHSLSSSARILGTAEAAELGSGTWTTMGWFWWVPKEQSIFSDRIFSDLGREKGSNDLLQPCHPNQSWALLTPLAVLSCGEGMWGVPACVCTGTYWD